MQTRDLCPVCRTVQRDDTRGFRMEESSAKSVPSTHAHQRHPPPADHYIPKEQGDVEMGGGDGNLDDTNLDLEIRGDLDLGSRRLNVLVSHEKSMPSHAHTHTNTQRHFAETPLMLQSNGQHVNPVLDKGSPLTGLPKGKRPQTDPRRGWRSQSVGRSPPWAPPVNPYSMTAGRSEVAEYLSHGAPEYISHDSGHEEHDSGHEERARSPLSMLPKMSGKELAAVVDGFAGSIFSSCSRGSCRGVRSTILRIWTKNYRI